MKFTTVIVVDSRTLEYLESSLPTWRLNQPSIFANPIVCVYDRILAARQLALLWSVLGDCSEGIERVAWPPNDVPDDAYASQRERMLSAFMAAASRHVKTDVWVKVDADVLAWERCERLVEPEWFDLRECECWQDGKPRLCVDKPRFAAPRWGYTKNRDGRPWLSILDDWGDSVPALNEHPRLNIPESPGQVRVGHRRHCSWVAAYRTDWTQRLVAMLEPEWWRLPVPSQDTVSHYVASRRSDPWLAVNMKARGLTNAPKLRTLQEMALRIVRGEPAFQGAAQ